MAPSGITFKQFFIVLVWNAIRVFAQESCRISALEPPLKFSFNECQNSENGWNHNCQLSLSCEPGNMPTVPIPIMALSGIQTLRCDNGKWMTTYNTEASLMRCVPGCLPRNYTSRIVNDRQIFTYYDIELEKTFTAGCQTSVVTTREQIETLNPGITAYYCPLSDADVSASGCENMCAMLYRIPNGNKIVKPFVEVNDDMFMFTFGEMEMIVECQEGYEYERSSLYSSNGRQVIVCDGASGKLLDNITRSEAQIAACVEKPKCANLSMSSNVDMTSENSQCFSTNGLLSTGCIRSYYCREGNYPIDPEYLYNGTQRVRCDNTQWFDQRNRTVLTSLTCASGCVNLNYTGIISYLTNRDISINYDEFELNGFKMQCLTSESRTVITQFVQNIRDHNSSYFCRDGQSNNQTHVVVETTCQNSCSTINITFLPEGLEMSSTPSFVNVFGSPLVSTNTSYAFRCTTGYRYSDATARAIGIQRFTCLGNGLYLDSISRNIYESGNIVVALCEEIPRCPMHQWYPDLVATTVYNSTCRWHEITIGCQADITCIPNYYPTLEKYHSVTSVRKECRMTSNGEAHWVDILTGLNAEDYYCKIGCIPKPIDNIAYNHSDFEVICSFVSAAYGNHFYCNSSHDPANEPVCTHTCSPLQGAQSLTKTNLYETLIMDRFVVEGDGYRFFCPTGTIFRETRTNSKVFRCNGQQAYIDVSSNAVLNYVPDTCITATRNESTCAAITPQNDIYTTRRFTCTRDANNRFGPGCRVEIDCAEGSSFSATVIETHRSYICVNSGVFRNIDTNTLVEVLNDVCRVYNMTTTTASNPTTTTLARESMCENLLLYVLCCM